MSSIRALVCLVLLSVGLHAQQVYVNASAAGAQDGTSWADAYSDLQSALAAVSSGDIWIAQGTYHPGAPGDLAATFQLKSGVGLYGGFDGTEVSLAERDVAANVTALSGDLDNDDTYGAGPNWWQFGWSGSLGNSYHVVTGSGADATALLDGVSILAGVGRDPVSQAGGGLLVLGGAPTLRGCTFRYNSTGYGSSAYLMDCTSSFENCVIKDAYTCNCGSGGWVSGILCTGLSNVSFTDCDFLNHYYVSNSNQGRGAALSVDSAAKATLIGCRFIGNQTGNFYPIGGGTAMGAGVQAFGDLIVDRCEFIDNFAHAGAGLSAWGNLTLSNSLFARNEAVGHPNGSGFEDGDYGAGLVTLGFGSPVVTITNCTFVDNNCEKGAGMALYGATTATVRNCIVYDNDSDPTLPGEDLVWILKQNITGSYDLANSCIEGLLQTEPGEDPPDPSDFPGCIDTDPVLVDVFGGDYRLAISSPCIDSGDSTALTMSLDLDDNPRAFDDPLTADTGIGPAPVVDMGAYEFGSEPGDPWSDLGQGLAGSGGQIPVLSGSGALLGNDLVTLSLNDAPPNAAAFLIAGFSNLSAPFKGGTLVPSPDVIVPGLSTDVGGALGFSFVWPLGIPANFEILYQYWIVSPSGPSGYFASNGLQSTTP